MSRISPADARGIDPDAVRKGVRRAIFELHFGKELDRLGGRGPDWREAAREAFKDGKPRTTPAIVGCTPAFSSASQSPAPSNRYATIERTPIRWNNRTPPTTPPAHASATSEKSAE